MMIFFPLPIDRRPSKTKKRKHYSFTQNQNTKHLPNKVLALRRTLESTAAEANCVRRIRAHTTSSRASHQQCNVGVMIFKRKAALDDALRAGRRSGDERRRQNACALTSQNRVRSDVLAATTRTRSSASSAVSASRNTCTPQRRTTAANESCDGGVVASLANGAGRFDIADSRPTGLSIGSAGASMRNVR